MTDKQDDELTQGTEAEAVQVPELEYVDVVDEDNVEEIVDAANPLGHLTQAQQAKLTQDWDNLTKEGFYEIITALDALDEQSRLPEAGGVAWTSLYGKNGGEMNVTGRGTDTVAAIVNLMNGVKYAMDNYHMSPVKPGYGTQPTSAPAPVVSSTPATTQTKAPVVPPPMRKPSTTTPAGAPKTPPPASTQEQYFTCVAVEVTQRANGQLQVAFYGDEFNQPVNKYPTLSFFGTPEKCVELFANVPGWTRDHFLASARYDNLSFTVFWKESERLNKAGNPYKDVIALAA